MTQGLLSFDRAPPISAPLRFFLTAPLFLILAGILLLYRGPDIFSSRWSPAALALTHLVTAGFMLQVMLGALQQLMPVVVGANLARPLLTATLVHAAITPGTLFLAAAFLTYEPVLFGCAVAFLAAGVMIFVWAAASTLRGVAVSNPTTRGFRLALAGLSVTLASGALLAATLGMRLNLPVLQITDLHLGWGFMAWGCTLLAAVGVVVVPMFQLTPEYPAWFGQSFARTVLGVITLWSVTDLLGWTLPSALFAAALVACGVLFALLTLNLLRRTKRPKHDASHHLWRVGMFSACGACGVWVVSRLVVAVGESLAWPVLFAVLLLFGGFVSVTVGMLYKIVPFLVWLHLQNRGGGQVHAPNMKKVLPQTHIDRQMRAHLLSLALLLLSAFWPTWFVYPAGVALIIANGWLLRNLFHATTIYRSHLATLLPELGKPGVK